jgi:anti-anti-sigma regulatory factor
MSAERADLQLVPEHRAESTVVTVSGTLSLASYPELRDGLLKIATDARDGVVADIGGLRIEDDSLASVFSVIAMRISDWPGIPFALVTSQPGLRALLAARAVDRFVAVHDDVAAAERALDHPPYRRMVRLLIVSDTTSAVARQIVRQVCEEWQVPEHTEDAMLIATELVENTIRHTESAPRLRLELRRDVLTVAVADDDPREAVLLERLDRAGPGLGLRMVAAIARVWGCSRSWLGGKVVWAVLGKRGPPRPRTGG